METCATSSVFGRVAPPALGKIWKSRAIWPDAIAAIAATLPRGTRVRLDVILAALRIIIVREPLITEEIRFAKGDPFRTCE
jgi:hypothetical protein